MTTENLMRLADALDLDHDYIDGDRLYTPWGVVTVSEDELVYLTRKHTVLVGEMGEPLLVAALATCPAEKLDGVE